MDTLVNIRAFLATVRCGSFSAASVELDVMPSVILKRVQQLEKELEQRLFTRTTRRVVLTEAGERLLPELKALVEHFHAIRSNNPDVPGELGGTIRIKSPTVLGRTWVSKVISRFVTHHPKVNFELILADRSVNPAEENFDIAISIWPGIFPGVVEIPLQRYSRMLVASPAYLEGRTKLKTPFELTEHDCLGLVSTGQTWSFNDKGRLINVEIKPRLSVNDVYALLQFAIDGHGIALTSEISVRSALKSGSLKSCLLNYPPIDFEVTARIPQSRMDFVRVQKFMSSLKSATPIPPISESDVPKRT
jgi:DNA-binding transcriptional LysR family regulator